MVSVCFARFLTGICHCVVGAGWVVSSAMDAAKRFLLRRGHGVECSVNVSDVSFCQTFTPPRTMCCSFLFLFRFYFDLFVAVVACCLGRVGFGSDVVLEAVGW